MARSGMWMTQAMVDVVNVIFWGCLGISFSVIYVVGSRQQNRQEREERKAKGLPEPIGFTDFLSPKKISAYTVDSVALTGCQKHPVNHIES